MTLTPVTQVVNAELGRFLWHKKGSLIVQSHSVGNSVGCMLGIVLEAEKFSN